MLEIKVTVEAPALAEAINNLAGAMGSAARIPAAVDAQATQTNVTPFPMNPPVQAAQSAPVAPTPAPAPAQTATSGTTGSAAPLPANGQPVPAPTPTPATAAKSYTLDEIGRAGAALVERGKMQQLVALMGRYGVQTIVQLNPAQYNAVAEELKALGAKL